MTYLLIYIFTDLYVNIYCSSLYFCTACFTLNMFHVFSVCVVSKVTRAVFAGAYFGKLLAFIIVITYCSSTREATPSDYIVYVKIKMNVHTHIRRQTDRRTDRHTPVTRLLLQLSIIYLELPTICSPFNT